MPQDETEEQTPRRRPGEAVKKPGDSGTDAGGAKGGVKSADREARLAEALRANLRRRKASGGTTDRKED